MAAMVRVIATAFLLIAAVLPAAAQPVAPNLDAVTRLLAEAPPDARSARTLGTKRDGNGVIIDSQGLVLTIGYLINEAMSVTVFNVEGKSVPAKIVGYDYETGFGLVRALAPLGRRPVQFGNSSTLKGGEPMLAVGHGGSDGSVATFVTDRRPFAGAWEYLVEDAIFTAPAHPNWGGTALLGVDGRLYGIGSLQVGNANREGQPPEPGNMFVPIDLLKPIFADLLAEGRNGSPQRPWLGIYTTELMGRLMVTQVLPGGPADKAGIKAGDVLTAVGGKRVAGMADFYRTLWAGRDAGALVDLRLLRSGEPLTLRVASGNRYDYLQKPKTY